MGEGPCYTLLRTYHLCHLEVAKTIRRALEGRPPLLNNGTAPSVQVVGVAKRPLAEGECLRHPMGSFDVRGVAVRIADHPDHVPMASSTAPASSGPCRPTGRSPATTSSSPRAGRSRSGAGFEILFTAPKRPTSASASPRSPVEIAVPFSREGRAAEKGNQRWLKSQTTSAKSIRPLPL